MTVEASVDLMLVVSITRRVVAEARRLTNEDWCGI